MPTIRHDSILEDPDGDTSQPRHISDYYHVSLKNVMITWPFKMVKYFRCKLRLRQFWLPQTLYFKNTVKCNSFISTYLGSHAVHEHNTRFLLNNQVKHMRGQADRVYIMLHQKCQTQGTSDVFRIMLSPWSWAGILWWFGKVVLPLTLEGFEADWIYNRIRMKHGILILL